MLMMATNLLGQGFQGKAYFCRSGSQPALSEKG